MAGHLPQNAPWLSENCRFPINTAFPICRYIAEIASLETKILVGNPQTNDVLQARFVSRQPEIIERALVGCFCIIKPFVTESLGSRSSSVTLTLDFAYSFNFTPEEFDEHGGVTAGFFTDKIRFNVKLYARIERHKFSPQAGLKIIENEFYVDEPGRFLTADRPNGSVWFRGLTSRQTPALSQLYAFPTLILLI